MDAEKQANADLLLQFAGGLWVSRAVWAFAHLNIADCMTPGDAGSSLNEIAERAGVLPDRLSRLLKGLSTIGVVARLSDDQYALTPMSQLLRSDDNHSLRAFIDSVFGGEHYEAFGQFDQALKAPTTSFKTRFGDELFEYYKSNPKDGERFAQAMTDYSRPLDEAIAEYEFPPFEKAVDIGGSHGRLLSNIIKSRPEASGVVFDLPHAVASAKKEWADNPEPFARLDAVGGDFFESVFAGGDLYIMKFILHDWTDEQCETILKNVRAAITEGGRLAVVEMVLPDDVSFHPGWAVDLNMMAVTGGKERTASEYQALLKTAGFAVERMEELPANLKIIQATAI